LDDYWYTYSNGVGCSIMQTQIMKPINKPTAKLDGKYVHVEYIPPAPKQYMKPITIYVRSWFG